MMGQKLRNIFVAKYLPLLKRMGGIEVQEKTKVVISFKFILNKLHVLQKTESDNLTYIPIDLPKEGDIIEALTKALGLFLL